MSISIIAACRNEVHHIRPFLDSVLSQDLDDLEWELLVADGGSKDGTREILNEYTRAHPSHIRILDNPDQFVSPGLNCAIKASHGDTILRMDAHTEYAPDYVRTCLRELERTGAANVGGPARVKAEGRWHRAIMLAYRSPFSCGGAKFHNENYEGFVDTVPYGCWRKQTLLQIGLFDETLVRNQDDELNFRLIRAGCRVWQSPAIRSWYTPRNTLGKLFRQYYQYGFWKVAVVRKHRIPASWRHLVPMLFVLAAVLLPISSVVCAALNGPSVCALAAVALGTLYLLCAIIEGVRIAGAQERGLALIMPIVFFTYHASYGLGFLRGLVHWLVRGRNTPMLARELTR